MAQIVLGIGTSHTPMLLTEPELWPRFLERETSLPLVDSRGDLIPFADLLSQAGSRFLDKANPQTFLADYTAGQEHLNHLADVLSAAQPDALIIVGDDQEELFHKDVQPSIGIFNGATVRHVRREPRSGAPEWFIPIMQRYYPEQAEEVPVAQGLAEHLVQHLQANDFDISISNTTPRGEGIGHAYSFVRTRLMRDRVIPVVPVFINTYYRPNQPSPRRCYHLGQQIAAAVKSLPSSMRVAVLASGGLSHFSVDEVLDQEIITAIKTKDAKALMTLPLHKLNYGSSEIRNWICAAGALEALDVDWVEYIPSYRTAAGTGVGLCFATWK